MDELGIRDGAVVDGAAEVDGARVCLGVDHGACAGEGGCITADDAQDTVVVIKVAVSAGKILEGEGAITNGFDVHASIGVEGANEEDITILAEHHRCIEAGATGDSPVVEGGSVAALGESEARSEVAADGGTEGVGIGNRNGVAVGIVDREGAVASGIDG